MFHIAQVCAAMKKYDLMKLWSVEEECENCELPMVAQLKNKDPPHLIQCVDCGRTKEISLERFRKLRFVSLMYCKDASIILAGYTNIIPILGVLYTNLFLKNYFH